MGKGGYSEDRALFEHVADTADTFRIHVTQALTDKVCWSGWAAFLPPGLISERPSSLALINLNQFA